MAVIGAEGVGVKRLLGPALAMIILVAGAITLLSYLGGDSAPVGLVLAESEGSVHITDAQGHESEVAAGTVLAPQERVATGPSSRAVLTLGDEGRIRLGPNSTVQVRAQSDDAVTLELEGGALQATVRPGTSALRVGNRGREVLATDAVFEMGLGDEGTLVVEASEGGVATTGFEGVSAVQAGERATVGADGVAQIAPLSNNLLLAVQWPTETRTREQRTQVSGTTVPGARVKVSGGEQPVEVYADRVGKFQVEVALLHGPNALAVEAVDPLGKVAQVDGFRIEVDQRGPTFRGGVEYQAQPP